MCGLLTDLKEPANLAVTALDAAASEGTKEQGLAARLTHCRQTSCSNQRGNFLAMVQQILRPAAVGR